MPPAILAWFWLHPCAWGSSDEGTESAADSARERAKVLFDRGSTLYASANFEAALLSFREAQVVYPLPAMNYNIANCYEQLGRDKDALVSMKRYLGEVREKDRARVEGRIEILRARIDAMEAGRPTPDVMLDPVVAAPVRMEPVTGSPRWWLVGLGAGVAVGGGALTAYGASHFDEEGSGSLTGAGVAGALVGAGAVGFGFALPQKKK